MLTPFPDVFRKLFLKGNLLLLLFLLLLSLLLQCGWCKINDGLFRTIVLLMIQTFQAPSLKTRTHSYHTWRRARNKRQGKWIRWPRVPEMPGDCSHGPPSEVLLQLLGSGPFGTHARQIGDRPGRKVSIL